VGCQVRHCQGRRPAVSGLKIEVTINILWRRASGKVCGGGTMSTTVGVVMRRQGGGFGNDGSNSGVNGGDDGDNGGGDVAVLVATRAGVGQRNEIGWGEEENLVMTVAAMLSCGVGGGGKWRDKRGGGRREASLLLRRMTTTMGGISTGIFTRPPPPTQRRWMRQCCRPLLLLWRRIEDYDNKGSGS
jgi:hypothetical protein